MAVVGSFFQKFIWPTFSKILLVIFIFGENCSGVDISKPSANNCATHIFQYEKQHQIPTGLLYAMSKVETGRKDGTGHVISWPWTVNAAGQGYYFPTKEAAITAVRHMQAKGIQSIDVGCMQVNLYHHPQAFKNLDDAFDPAKNIAYAAGFLKALKDVHSSWYRAIAHYHSANPMHHIPYQKMVLNVWKHDTKNGVFALGANVFEAFSSQIVTPMVNHIRRLSKAKTLSLHKDNVIPSSAKGSVRKVIRGNSRHIRRI